MLLARVTGTVVASHKDPQLEGTRMLLLQPLGADRKPVGRQVVALDAIGAGAAEEVFYVRGREAALPFLPREVPSDATVIGIVDPVSGSAAAVR
jgi:microcompartment protein CcmK/EutM